MSCNAKIARNKVTQYSHAECKNQSASSTTVPKKPSIISNLLGIVRPTSKPIHQDLKQNKVSHTLIYSNV